MSTKNAAAIAKEDEQTPAEIIRDLAVTCVTKAPDWQTAAKMMRKHVDSSPTLMRALTEQFIDDAIWNHIRTAARHSRIPFENQDVANDNATDLRAMSSQRRLDWLNYQLSGGTRLGDADRERLKTEEANHAALAHGNTIKAMFFREIAKKIDGHLVRDVLDHAAITKIWEKVSC